MLTQIGECTLSIGKHPNYSPRLFSFILKSVNYAFEILSYSFFID
jgi:hypothetical protein